MKVFVDNIEVKPEELDADFYMVRLGQHRISSVPRQKREKVLEIIKNAKQDVYLTPADFPFIYLYKNFRN